MKFLVACIIAVCVLPQAFAIKCYECKPNMAGMGNVNVTQNMTQEDIQQIVDSMQLCQKPTKELECPSHMEGGVPIDACMDMTIGMSFKIPVVNLTINVTMRMVNCSSSALCSPAGKKMVCDGMKPANGSSNDGPMIHTCDIDCCTTDLCNDGVEPTTTPTAETTTVALPTSKGAASRGRIGAMFASAAMFFFLVFYY